MRRLRHSLILAALMAMPSLVPAQTPPLVETLSVAGDNAYTWNENQLSIAQFEGPVKFHLDDVTMKADSAVMWLKVVPGSVLQQQQVEIALIGNASLQQGDVRRSGEKLYVTALVSGSVRLSANQRLSIVRADTSQYQLAQSMREESGLTAPPDAGRWRLPTPSPLVETPEKGLPRSPTALAPRVEVRFKSLQTITLPDGNLAVVIEGNAQLVARKTERQMLEMSAQRICVLTKLKKFTDLETDGQSLQLGDAVDGVYLEGDVQIDYLAGGRKSPESRLQANRAYYDIGTDRAVLTDAVFHTTDPSMKIPVVVRAQTIKQLSQEPQHSEYKAEKAQLTTSTFATPTFAIAASKTYITQSAGQQEAYGKVTTFQATNTRAEFWGFPVFWTPYAAGLVTEHGFPLRTLDIGSSKRFGFYSRSEWGLFESMGRVPPKGLDITYQVDYLFDRGPGGGVDAKYSGGYVTDAERQPWNFEGSLDTYLIDDHGTDKFGGDREDVDPEKTMRGQAIWQHQHFLPDDWQVQLHAAWVSDPTFLEEYYPNEYRGDLTQETSAYLKHQRDTEALTLLVTTQPNDFVTSSEYAQENFEIQRMPEIGYHRIGDSFADDSMTFFSANSLSALKMQQSSATLAELGYGPGLSPGMPAQGKYGTASDTTDRGDTREEVDYPLQVDRFRVVPYIMGRYTYYSQSVGGGVENRVYSGTGVRASTAFWKVDDYASSEFWDIHRVRHVIEPEAHLFVSGQTVDQQDLLIYDQGTDAINDVSAVQLAMHQRWQTKRGGPADWRSVDFFTWNSDVTLYGNQPNAAVLDPASFRGMYFESSPETSIPRNSFNNDATWRVNDSTAVLADSQYNLDENDLATAAGGLVLQRGERTTWYVGDRYINELDSNIFSVLGNYELSTRYTLGFGQSYDFGGGDNVSSSFSVMRHFDVFYLICSVRFNDNTGDSGFFVSIRPNYMAPGPGSNMIPSALTK